MRLHKISKAILSLLIIFISLQSFAEEKATAKNEQGTTKLAIDPKLINDLNLAIEKKDWSEVIKLSSSIIALDPNHIYALESRAKANSQSQNLKQAITDYATLAQLSPSNSGYLVDLCWSQILSGQFLEARLSCQAANNKNPSEFASIFNLGHTYLLMGDLSKAEYWYKKSIPLLNSEAELNNGSLSDFDIFIANGWKVESCIKQQAWFQNIGNAWVEQLKINEDLTSEAEKAKKANNLQLEINFKNKIVTNFERFLIKNELGLEHIVFADSMNKLAELLRVTNHYAEAESLYRRALAINENVLGPDHTNVAITRNNLALLMYNTGHYNEAESLHRRILAINEKALGPDHAEVANSLNNLAELLISTDNYAEAESLHRRALAINEKALGHDHTKVAISLNNLASLLEETDHNDEAEALIRRALAINKNALEPDHKVVAHSLDILATLMIKTDRFAEAESMYRQALEINEKALGPDNTKVSTSLNNLAILMKKTTRYAEAESMYRQALEIREKALGPEHTYVATSLNNLALLLEETGRYAEAEALIRRALAIDEKALGHDNTSIAFSLNNLASLLQSNRNYVEAESMYRRALAIYEKALGDDHTKVAVLLNNLALLLEETGRYAEAEALIRRALAIDEKALGQDHTSIATHIHNLAALMHSTSNDAEGIPLFIRAYNKCLISKNLKIKWSVAASLRKIYTKTQPDLAVFFGKQSVNVIQDSRANLKKLDKTSQEAYLKTVETYYKKLSTLLFDQGRISEAQQVLSMLKEQEYSEFIHDEKSPENRATRATYNRFEEAANAKLKVHEQKLGLLSQESQTLRDKQKIKTITSEETKRLQALEAEIKQAEEEFNKTFEEVKAIFANIDQASQLAENAKMDSANETPKMVRSLGKEVALLQYVVLEDIVYIVATSGDQQVLRKVSFNKGELDTTRQNFLEKLKNPTQDPRPAGQALYQLLIAPVEADIANMHAKTVMLSLDGALRYVPFAALYDGKQYLAEKYALVLYNEAARDRLKDRAIDNWKVAGFGLTKAKQGFDALPAVTSEMSALVKTGNNHGILPGTVQLDEQFTPGSLKTKLQDQYPVVHIASHFKFDPASDHESFLLLGDGTKLSLNAIRTQGYSFKGVDLLTLSACQTGVGGRVDTRGREVEGLGVLAQKQGAKGVVATLWSVADASTGLFMPEFYRLRQAEHLSIAEALRQAQIEMINGNINGKSEAKQRGERVSLKPDISNGNPNAPYAHPYYWAPFILMGNWL